MSAKPYILGIQYGGHDTAAALTKGDELLAACEQERYSLDKHSRKFPIDAVNDCLKIGGIKIDDVDEIAFCADVNYYIRETYLKTAIKDDDRIGFLIKDIDKIKEHYYMADIIREKTGYKGKVSFHLHHLCHLASAYYPSGFENALLASYDGMGEIETGLLATGKNGVIEVINKDNFYPDSLGLLYTAMTYYLGFRPYCDEGIIMGLASYGDPSAKIPGSKQSYRDVFNEIIRETGDYSYEIDRSWIEYYRVRDTWVSEKFKSLFGPKKEWEETITEHHQNIAAALQDRLETIVLSQLEKARDQFDLHKLCLAGGVALNCSMNGKIESKKIFDEIFVQPASGDSGTVVGACYLAYKNLAGGLKPRKMHNFYKGSSFADEEIESAFKDAKVSYQKPDDLFASVAQHLAGGKIVGWFQGGAEFGPRALGNRSILTRPYPNDMKDYLNKRVKFREEFRPFAPAVLAEHCSDYFTLGQESPHMLIACKIRADRHDQVPAIVHVDKTCRVQTVKEENNPRFRKLLEAFHKITECPVLLNTSFNVKGQPIVNTPKQAIDSFQSTNIDVLAVGSFLAEK